ncbi:MAG: FAD-linked oxidase C-terminal domain-containing protein, partial [Candidatus Sericytochromatia bacterium]
MMTASTEHARELAEPALQELTAICGPARTLRRWLDRVAYASDASFYHLVPLAVLQPRDREEVRAIFAWSQQYGVPITFRTAGTSLSGQAVTDGLLLDLSKHWRGVEALEEGAAVWVQPGVVGAHVNAVLRPHGRKIGPDPASIQACMMGGILANNASGMCCGVSHNAYHTLRSVGFLLPDGKYFNTAGSGAHTSFLQECPQLAAELSALRTEILGNPDLRERIRSKYQQKNTTGYSLNALLDFEHPLDILAHLLIGSEGTLALIAEAVLETLPDNPFKYTGLLIFADLATACAQIAGLQQSGAAAIELMDDASLRALPPAALAPWLDSVAPGSCALLVEYQAESEADSRAQALQIDELMTNMPLLAAANFTHDSLAQQALWKLRKGLYPSVGAVRRSGSSVLIEDVVFPIERLAQAIERLHALFARHGYTEAIIFGHAKDGNLHFVLTPSFQSAEEVQRYDGLMQDLCAMVLELGGGLKAEHGTGRNMAPFVQAEWGPEAYALMLRLKAAIDPDNLFNPGVILNSNPQAHLEHLKQLPGIDPEVDRCTECGFCEPACPSRRVTLTPRQRIVLRRERQRLLANGESELLAQLEADYVYAG